MKKFSDKVNENNINTYKYSINVTIEGNVSAETESDAGELVDQIIDEINGVTNYSMNSLNLIGSSELTENIVNDKSTEDTLIDTLNKYIQTNIKDLNESQQQYVLTNLFN